METFGWILPSTIAGSLRVVQASTPSGRYSVLLSREKTVDDRLGKLRDISGTRYLLHAKENVGDRLGSITTVRLVT